ncbi:MAG: hypothetical protein KGJ78_17230 [Alphaproteobacteria bacterium]|nr:hypothetical protein [Alphaproteobacteria bacterium]
MMYMHYHEWPFLFLWPLGWMFWIVGFLVFALPMMEIIHKAGYSRVWILIWFVPVVNVIFLWIFAFSRWPSQGTRV